MNFNGVMLVLQGVPYYYQNSVEKSVEKSVEIRLNLPPAPSMTRHMSSFGFVSVFKVPRKKGKTRLREPVKLITKGAMDQATKSSPFI